MAKWLKVLLGVIMSIKLQPAIAGNFFQANSVTSIMSHLANLPKNSTIFIDIDDTIITPISKTFRAPPYNKLIDDIKKHKDKYPNYEAIVSNWRLQRKVMLIDKNWPLFLSQLKKEFTVYGLTKMDSGKFGNIASMEQWRYQELKNLGIEFSNHSSVPEGNKNGASFYKGLFITGVNSKSQTIAHYLQYLKTNTLVLIDDRKEHIEDVEQFCKNNAIAFIGILYSGLAKFQGKPDPSVAAFQKQYLIERAQWLEDEAAELKAKSQP